MRYSDTETLFWKVCHYT